MRVCGFVVAFLLALIPWARAEARPPWAAEQLQIYSESYLERLLGPLNGEALPRAELAQCKADYQARLGAAKTMREKAAFQAALDVCRAFERLMDERVQCVAALGSGGQAVDFNAVGGTKSSPAPDDRQAPAGEGKKPADAVPPAAGAAPVAEQWKERGALWRAGIRQLLIRQMELECTAVDVSAVATAPGAATPPPTVAVPDPIEGEWRWEHRAQVRLNGDHTIDSLYKEKWIPWGKWAWTGEEKDFRTYLFYLDPGEKQTEGSIQRLWLTADGKELTGFSHSHKVLRYYPAGS